MRTYVREAKIVLLGGGTGSCRVAAVLNEIFRFLSIIVTGADDGGDSKFYRRAGHPAWGDIRRAILTIAENEYLKRIMPFRLGPNMGEREGINIGNLLMAATYEMYRKAGYTHKAAVLQTVDDICEQAGLDKGRCAMFASTDFTHLGIALEDGSKILGEGEIDDRVYDGKRIVRAYLDPPAKIDERAERAILSADYIVIGPGSWFGSVIATLLVKGVAEAVQQATLRQKNPAKIMCVANLFTSVEDHGFRLSEFLRFVHGHLGGQMIDACIFNNYAPEDVVSRYYSRDCYPVVYDRQSLDYCDKVIQCPCLEVDEKGHARHSASIANIFTNLEKILDLDDRRIVVGKNGRVESVEKVLL